MKARVARNMQDHYVARVSYPVVGAQTANERSGITVTGITVTDYGLR